MHLPLSAGPRRRTRRALLAAALPAALAATALPAAADAATVQMVNSGALRIASFNADAGEVNNLRVSFTAAGIVFDDQVPIRTVGSECRIDAAGNGVCPGSATDIIAFTGDRDDTIQYAAPHPGGVFAGDGSDMILAGLRQGGTGRAVERVFYTGDDTNNNSDSDTVSYRLADRGVRVDSADGLAQDGRPGDLERVDSTIEQIEGSNFADVLFGSDNNDRITGLNGDDEIGGGQGNDVLREEQGPNGADSLNGGDGVDRVLYTGRTRGVNISLDGVRNDGEPGENDDVRPNVENVTGSSNGFDTLVGNSLTNDFDGLGGNDNLIGAGGNDTLSGGAGNNRLAGEAGNDVIRARNGELDNIDCGEDRDGADRDTVNRDSAENQVVGCESGTVGVLRLTPTTVRTEAGKVARMRLSWRHPDGWRKLRTIELRLFSADGVPVGEVTMRPRAQRITDDGAVRLVRRASRLARKGKTVTARLAVRLDDSVAGQKLGVEVEATDARARRQLERDAGTVRVAR